MVAQLVKRKTEKQEIWAGMQSSCLIFTWKNSCKIDLQDCSQSLKGHEMDINMHKYIVFIKEQ